MNSPSAPANPAAAQERWDAAACLDAGLSALRTMEVGRWFEPTETFENWAASMIREGTVLRSVLLAGSGFRTHAEVLSDIRIWDRRLQLEQSARLRRTQLRRALMMVLIVAILAGLEFLVSMASAQSLFKLLKDLFGFEQSLVTAQDVALGLGAYLLFVLVKNLLLKLWQRVRHLAPSGVAPKRGACLVLAGLLAVAFAVYAKSAPRADGGIVLLADDLWFFKLIPGFLAGMALHGFYVWISGGEVSSSASSGAPPPPPSPPAESAAKGKKNGGDKDDNQITRSVVVLKEPGGKGLARWLSHAGGQVKAAAKALLGLKTAMKEGRAPIADGGGATMAAATIGSGVASAAILAQTDVASASSDAASPGLDAEDTALSVAGTS